MDVLIIGAGVIGCAIARLLSFLDLDVQVAEALEDVGMGASRANSAIVHAGYDAKPGSLMARYNVEGNALYTSWCEELDVHLMRPGSLVLAFDDADEQELQKLLEMGMQNGVPGLALISGDDARTLEPVLSPHVTRALWAPTAGITCPYQFTIACYENARANGVAFHFDAPVTQIEDTGDGFTVIAGDKTYHTRYVINTAGVFADEIAQLAGDLSFAIHPRRGEYLLLDKTATSVQRVLFQTPSALGKGVLVAPTVDGNCYAGPTAEDIKDKRDTQTTQAGMDKLRKMSLRSVPTLNLRASITAFAGLRAVPSTGDFIIGTQDANPSFVNVAGICSPGLTSAPAIAQAVVALLPDAMKGEKPHARVRKGIPAFATMTDEEKAAAIAQNPLYGRVICRCETVTEAEIVDAIHRGARSLDAVKRRTRAGMGRCQGGFCAPRVMDILARETGQPMETLTKFGASSTLLAGRLKEVSL